MTKKEFIKKARDGKLPKGRHYLLVNSNKNFVTLLFSLGDGWLSYEKFTPTATYFGHSAQFNKSVTCYKQSYRSIGDMLMIATMMLGSDNNVQLIKL